MSHHPVSRGLFAVLSLAALAVVCIAVIGTADDSSADGLYYQFVEVEGGYDLIISGTGAIPDYANPYDPPWAQYSNLIKGIVVSDGATYVGRYAFVYCGEATSATIADSVTSIGDLAFAYNTKMETISLPEHLTSIGDQAFRECGLTSAVIPDEVASIGEEAFKGCINLRDLYISDGLVELGTDAFGDLEFYYPDGTTPVPADVTHLRGARFTEVADRLVLVSTDLVVEGSVCSVASDTYSAGLTVNDITFLKERAESDTDTTLRLMLKGGIVAAFDRNAILTFADQAAVFSVEPVDKSTLSGELRELVGDGAVFGVSFGGNLDLGDGNATLTVPYDLPSGSGADTVKASFVKGDQVSGTSVCAYEGGKATFSTGMLSMFFVDSEESPSGGGSGFPLWIPVVIAIAAIGAVALFLFAKKRGS